MPRFDLYRRGELDIQVALKNEKIIIGRSETCDFRINDPTVSRLHALIFPMGDGFILRNLSRQGLRINDERMEADRPLVVGDRIHLGQDIVLVFHGETVAAFNEVAVKTQMENGAALEEQVPEA